MPFYGITFGKVHQSWKKMTCKPNPSVVSFLPWLALMKTTVLKSMRTLPYLRLDTLYKWSQWEHSGILYSTRVAYNFTSCLQTIVIVYQSINFCCTITLIWNWWGHQNRHQYPISYRWVSALYQLLWWPSQVWGQMYNYVLKWISFSML